MPTVAHTTQPSPISALVIQGWTVRVDGPEPRVRDLDLAEKAELRVPRDIRRTIRAAIEDGALTAIYVGGAHVDREAQNGPKVWVERETWLAGKGAAREGEVYYLNEEGALLVLTRLRTPMAVAATRALVMVCAAARRGELEPMRPKRLTAPLDPRPGIEAALRVLPGLAGLMGEAWAKTRAEHYLARLSGEEPERNAPRLLTVSDYLSERGVTGARLRSLAPAFGKAVKARYRAARGVEPPTVERFVDGALRPVAAYDERDRALFDDVFGELDQPEAGGLLSSGSRTR